MDCCNYSNKEFLVAILNNVVITPCEDLYFKSKSALASGEFDGTEVSFQIACGNISGRSELKNYGLYCLTRVLTGVADLYTELGLNDVNYFVLAHYGHMLIKLENTSISHGHNNAYLDISDLIDAMKTEVAASSLPEVIHNIDENALAECVMSRKSRFDAAFDEFHKHKALVTNGVIILGLVAITALTFMNAK